MTRIEPSSVKMDDGRWRHTFRQSWLNAFEKCPEQARRELFGLLPERRLTDSLIGGIVLHAVIEECLKSTINNGHEPDLSYALAAYDFTFDKMLEAEGGHDALDWIKRQEKGTRQYGRRALTTWYWHVLPDLEPQAVELEFGPLVLVEDEHRVIEVRGIIDYVDAGGLWDWKTTSRSDGYEPWEKERWDKQSTVYTWAADQLWLDVPADTFKFCVFLPGGEAQIVEVTRGPGDWAWMKEQAISVATLIEAELPVWPLNDAGWHCSSKWCPAWADCKGKHVGLEAW